MKNDLIVVIPAYNEALTIAEIVARTRAQGYVAVVVDDASDDGTSEAAAGAGAEVLRLARRCGNLGAIKAGLAWAREQEGCRWLATLDGDGQHAPEDIPALLKAARRHPDRLIIGSCPERSSWMRQMVWSFFRKLTGLKIRDMTSGFKIYPRQAAACLCAQKTSRLGYQDVPTLLTLTAYGFEISEIPVSMAPRRVGISRVFSSWGKVALYMSKVTWQCLRHRPHLAVLKLRLRLADYRRRPDEDAPPTKKQPHLPAPSAADRTF